MKLLDTLSIIIIFCISDFAVCEENPTDSEISSIESKTTIHDKASLETGYLETKPGFTGNVLGAEIKNISIGDKQETQIIDVILPIDPDDFDIDRVKILSKSGKPIYQDKSALIFEDYENDNVGIKLYLPKKKNLMFKLKLIDESEINTKQP